MTFQRSSTFIKLQISSSIQQLQSQLDQWFADGLRIGFVPTMGNLHQGHIALVNRAGDECDKVVVSIFVNPSQFGENDDLATYPHSPEADQALLESQSDYLFTPKSDAIYQGGECLTHIDMPPYTSDLCGKTRPGHFVGVLTVVNLLLNLVRPHNCYFGLKDYQQWWLIKRMVADLHCPTKVIGVDAARAKDGLAFSSRNQYLTEQEREIAPLLYNNLLAARNSFSDYAVAEKIHQQQAICDKHIRALCQRGFAVDYFCLRDADSLLPITANSNSFRLLVAARLGKTRLIDNIATS